MNDHILQIGLMWVVAGLSAGWLVEHLMYRRGYGLLVDMGLGVGASFVGGGVLRALVDPPAGMLVMFVIGFVPATALIVAQRLWWPLEPGALERTARRRLAELARPSRDAVGQVSAPGGAGAWPTGWPTPTRALARLATTGIYLLRGIPIEIQRAARLRAAREDTTLRQVLLRGLGEYAAGTWTPQADARLPSLADSARPGPEVALTFSEAPGGRS